MYGSFVRDVREARGLSQRQLAEISGVRASNISAIENDHRVPSAGTLNRLVVACGFELAAVAGHRALYCPLPRVGWFPDEDLPPPVAGDPADEAPALAPTATPQDHARALLAVLDAVDATMR